jgi:cytochrome b
MSQLAITFGDERSHQARFEAFHRANPKVYRELLRLARRAKARGHKRIGVRMLWEVMRWNLTIAVDRSADDFRLNDHYHSRFARMLAREPDLVGCFELRELKT